MNRNHCLQILLSFMSVVAISCSYARNAAADDPPNILFIGIDDLRTELSCYGAGHMSTPNMDRLAANGMRFERAYCQQAVCLPSRISLFTGLRPDSTGVRDLNTHFRDTVPNAVTLPQILKRSGYRTIGMGKLYHDEQPKEWDTWIDVKAVSGVSDYHLEENVADLARLESEARSQKLRGKAKRQLLKGPSVESADRPDEAFEDGAMTRLAIEQIQLAGKSESNKPFFLAVGFHRPHLPLVAPKKYWDLYDRSQIKLPENYYLPKDAPKLALSTWGELRAFKDIPQEGPLSEEKAIEVIHGYRACVSFIDAQVGQLLDALKEEGLDKTTIVVLWSDHGWKLGEHAMWCKHTNFEIDARVPLIVSHPKSTRQGSVSDAMVELVDLYPTVCEFADVSIPKACEGKSLVPILKGQKDVDWRKYALSQFTRRRKSGGDIDGYSIKFDRGRYTEWINRDSKKTVATEFYDHSIDPHENQNLHSELSAEEAESFSQLLREAISIK